MDLIVNVPARRFQDGLPSSLSDAVVNETRIELHINGAQTRMAMLCLAENLEALAVGFLRGEGLLRRREDLADVQALPEARRVVVTGDFDQEALQRLQQRWTWGSGCGGGGTSRDLDQGAYAPVGEGLTLAAGRIIELVEENQALLELWRRTGGVHGCALADAGGIVLRAEDVGRHNAFDKVVGLATLRGVSVEDKLVICTGRLSAELVSKAVACRLPMLVTRGAVTALGVELAKRFGLTLAGFARGKRITVYSGFQRVTGSPG